jgi:hypothetical protein
MEFFVSDDDKKNIFQKYTKFKRRLLGFTQMNHAINKYEHQISLNFQINR